MKDKKISVVKIDSDLLERIEEFINQENNKFNYVNKKQFVDLAVLEKLKKEENDGRKKKC
jgi:hypothetical protein